MNGKTLVAGVLSGLVFFLLGGLFYVMLFRGFFATAIDRAEPLVLFVLLGEVAMGIALAWVLDKTGGASLSAGAKTGATLGFLFALGMGFVLYGAYNMADLAPYLVDSVVTSVRWAVGGAVAGWFLGRGGSETEY